MNNFSIPHFTQLVRTAFNEGIDNLPGWGEKSEVKIVFEEAFQTAFTKCLEEMEGKDAPTR